MSRTLRRWGSLAGFKGVASRWWLKGMEMGEGEGEKRRDGGPGKEMERLDFAKIPVSVHGRWSLAINLRTAQLDM